MGAHPSHSLAWVEIFLGSKGGGEIAKESIRRVSARHVLSSEGKHLTEHSRGLSSTNASELGIKLTELQYLLQVKRLQLGIHATEFSPLVAVTVDDGTRVCLLVYHGQYTR